MDDEGRLDGTCWIKKEDILALRFGGSVEQDLMNKLKNKLRISPPFLQGGLILKVRDVNNTYQKNNLCVSISKIVRIQS